MGFILGTVLGTIVLVCMLGVVAYFSYKKNALKKLIKRLGASAEKQVNTDLKTWAKHTKNKFIAPSVYRYNENKVFEVDSILVTREAVIVVEIKSINGGIKGNANDDVWTKVLGENRFPITNPVKQNEKHIKHIINMMGIKVPVMSMIVFSNKAKYIDVTNTPGHVVIIKHADVFETLDSLTINLQSKFSGDMVKQIATKIKSYKADKKGVDLHKSITSNKGAK